MAQERAKKLVDWADKEKNLATVATTAGGKVVTSKPLLRDGSVTQDNVTPALLAQIFDTKQGSAGWGAAPDGKGYVLFKVKEITTPDPAANAGSRQEGRRHGLGEHGERPAGRISGLSLEGSRREGP